MVNLEKIQKKGVSEYKFKCIKISREYDNLLYRITENTLRKQI